MHKALQAFRTFFASLIFWSIATPAFAIGGLDKANDLAAQIKTGAYVLLGTCGTIYLIYMALMAFTEKKTWADFAWAVVHVAIAGGVVVIAGWAWSAFS
jgi:hypothetical protein